MADPVRVVFISRRNSLRSILAEACLASLRTGDFQVWSCGQPDALAGYFHPAALGALASAGIPPPAGAPKGWDALQRRAAPAQYVITLDQHLAHVAPRWRGQPELATWHFPDVAAEPEGKEQAAAAVQLLHALRRRLELFASLPLRHGDRSALRSDIRDIAHMR